MAKSKNKSKSSKEQKEEKKIQTENLETENLDAIEDTNRNQVEEEKANVKLKQENKKIDYKKEE